MALSTRFSAPVLNACVTAGILEVTAELVATLLVQYPSEWQNWKDLFLEASLITAPAKMRSARLAAFMAGKYVEWFPTVPLPLAHLLATNQFQIPLNVLMQFVAPSIIRGNLRISTNLYFGYLRALILTYSFFIPAQLIAAKFVPLPKMMLYFQFCSFLLSVAMKVLLKRSLKMREGVRKYKDKKDL